MQNSYIVQSLQEAQKAFAEARGVLTLMSPPEAAASLGAKGFVGMVKAAAAKFPNVKYTAILDCGDQAGLAMNALRLGVKDICVDLPTEVRAKIEDMATQCGARVHKRPNDCNAPFDGVPMS